MKLTEILPLDEWLELEKRIHNMLGLNAAVFNKDGFRITDYKNWANRLCPVIKGNEKGQSFICGVANQNMMAQAKETRKPVADECDAGLIKVAIPIFLNDEFLGIAGGCGLLPYGGEIESFLVSKVTGIDQGEIQGLSEDINIIKADKIEGAIRSIKERINKIIRDAERLK
ncbi:MAG TPA: PocR ligand-binding domain-containing protein [Desulfatiglandales bacterium]|nr:PocR ligand-binding domain-containing protein [Desulfatiglandales bacterium]